MPGPEKEGAARAAFEDHYSKQAAVYARHRPRYPDALFAYLASLAPGQDLAWDAGTGSGQAAVGLVAHFRRVWATDASPEQIGHAPRVPGVAFLVAPSSASGLDAASADLVTAAAAVHWFDLDPFFTEARRVLRPGGVLAVWTYFLLRITPAVDAVFAHYIDEVLAGYWPPRIDFAREGYRTLPFPFEELPAPEVKVETDWLLEDLIGYMRTWSSTQAFRDANGTEAVDLVRRRLERAWGDPDRVRRVDWPLSIRIGRVAGPEPR